MAIADKSGNVGDMTDQPAAIPARPVSPLIQQGLKFLEDGDAAGAELLLDTYLARNPTDADSHNIAGLAKRRLGNGEAALEHLRRAHELAPREALFAVNVAKLLLDLDRAEDALAIIDAFLTAQAGQADALLQRVPILHRLRRFSEATAVARMAVVFHRGLARAHHALGMSLLKEGKFKDAVTAFDEAVAIDPAPADTWINRGVALRESGSVTEAEASYRRALEIAPHDAIAVNNLANAVSTQGRLAEAVTLYRRAVELDSDYADAKANLGLAMRDAEDTEGALAFFEEAVAQHPDHVVLLNAYGNTLRQADRLNDAIATLTHAITVGPHYAEAFNNLGLAYAMHHKPERAAEYLKRAAELKPDSAVISNNYGALMVRMFRFDEAVKALANAVARDPAYDEALINLGVANYMSGNAAEAISAYTRVLERNPNNAFARYSLGVAYLEDQRLAEAEVEIRAALSTDPKNAMAHNTLGVLLLDQHHITDARAAMRQAADVNTESAPVFYSNYAFSTLYASDVSNAEVLDIHREYGRRFGTAEPDTARPHTNTRAPDRKLRIGYLSPDFRAHSVAYFFEAILEKHDRSKFEIALYSDTTRTDAVTRAMKAAADIWVDTAGLSDDAMAKRLKDDGVDILVNLAGHTSGNRLPVCALKPAPVQIEYLGYPETSGVSAQDYRLVDARTDPEGTADARSTERLVRLPDCFHCYRPGRVIEPAAQAPYIKQGHVTFASFNVLPKVTSQAIAAWATILKAVPGSHFLIKCKQLRDERVQARIRDEFAAEGVDPARIEMTAFMASVSEHLAQYGRVDLALDTFPYNGTTTTCESLYMGVPVLTMRGDNHRSRVGLSLLHAVGLSDAFVANDVADYIERAIAFGRNPKPLAEIRPKLRAMIEHSPLRDEVGFTRTLEKTYRDLWKTWCAGPATYALKSPPELRAEDSIQSVLVKTL